MNLRKMLSCAAALGAAVLIGNSQPAAAEQYPSRPVKLLVAYPPGGTTDVLARVLAARLSEKWAQPVIVENRPGAGGNIGTALVAKSAPDGYTLQLGAAATHAVNPAIFKSLPYDYVNDFTPISLAGVVPGVFVVNAQSSVRTLADLIAIASGDGKVSYGTPSAGSMSHLTGELLNQIAGIKMEHIPYKGSNPAVSDLLGGHIQALVDNLPPSLPHVKSGKLRALAVTSPQRSPELPDVPTMLELGYDGFDLQGWFAVFGPARMPERLVVKINSDIVAVLADPDVRTLLNGQGINSQSSTPAELADLVQRDSSRLIKVAAEAGISVQ